MLKITLADFLLPTEIVHARELYKQIKSGEEKEPFAKVFAREIIEPNIKRINEKLGQENDPMYLAYATEFVLEQTVGRQKRW